jgi:putative transposase
MRRSQHTEHEILSLLEEADAGISIAEICSTARISLRTFYRWRKRYGGLTSPALRHLRELEIENRRLRALVDKMSESRRDRRTPKPLDKLPRSDFGSSQASVEAAKQSRGACLGRFASIRYMR